MHDRPPAASPGSPMFSVVVPAYNEADVILQFHYRLSQVMDRLGVWEVVYVNDGSRDLTLTRLTDLQARDGRVAIVNLSRNFGKEIAVTAGLDHARGSAVILMDADLQHAPEVIPDLVAGWREGYDMVFAQRRGRPDESWLRRTAANAFYEMMRRTSSTPIPRDGGDFRLLSRRAVEAVIRLREQHRFMKGLFAWIGFPTKAVPFDVEPRHAGRSAWNYWRLLNFAMEGLTSFSVVPLRIATFVGLAVALLAVLYGLELVIQTLIFGNPVAGYPSVMTAILFLGGIQLMALGMIGEYLGRVFNETKNRPLYLIEHFSPSDLARAPDPPAAAGELTGAS